MMVLGQFQTLYYFFSYLRKHFTGFENHKTAKAQRRNQAKPQNAKSKQKYKMRLKKTSQEEKSHLFPNFRFCAFCTHEEKRIQKRKQKKEKSPHNLDVLKIPMLPQLG